MAEYVLEFPVTNEEEIKKLHVKDIVRINGIIIGLRDASLIRMFDDKEQSPINLKGAACLHTAPGVRKVKDKFEKVCIGTTTSTRMDRFTEPLLREYQAKAIIGKAGLLEASVSAMHKFCGCYLAVTGGAAALETTQIEEIKEVYWQDLMPECLWVFKVKNFGPLIVAIDSYGNNLYFDVKKHAQEQRNDIFKTF